MSSCLCGSVCKSSGCKTEIHYDEASYIWTITDFDFHEAKGERISSPDFTSIKNDQIKWNLLLYPNGYSRAAGYISLFLCLSEHSTSEKSEKIYVKMTYSVLTTAGEEYKKIFLAKEFHHFPPNNACGTSQFIKKDATFKNNMLLLKNVLRIRCELKFSDMKDIAENSHQRAGSCIRVPECDLSEHFVSMFEKQELTDVVLSVNGKDFSAHKVVLAAHSPVFHAMFKHNTKENQLNRVDIEDVDEQVVGEMLKYIYTGKCANLETLAGELLAAADKYDLYRLKTMCGKTLLDGLSIENAASVLALADMHGVKELKTEVIKFIVSKPTEVLATEGWKSIRSNFELVDEVLCLALARRSD
ncbi:speckle-type POZ protein B-like isoform X10 [Planococcus citri]|uniref:speckle-type POZ protein B-like isoform X10 n=1 Tax=Planococcus citri TaxID=170843 RepID=UPI0031F93074